LQNIQAIAENFFHFKENNTGLLNLKLKDILANMPLLVIVSGCNQ